MTATDKTPSRVIDWAAIRLAYETTNEPVCTIAKQHDIGTSAIERRVRSEGWPLRRDRIRITKGLENPPPNRLLDWNVIRREHETGGFSIGEICARQGISKANRYRPASLPPSAV